MALTVLSVGAILCASGAAAHFKQAWKRSEGGLVLGGFCCVVVALLLSNAGHF